MDRLQHLFENNAKWREEIEASNPGFFDKLAQQQKPDYLWIGCSDSRVPANQITGLLPGDVFVHRNIANVVVHTDLNCLSVIQYAVEVLGVKDVIVCGHYGCGGVMASLSNESFGLIDNWLCHIKDVARANQSSLAAVKDDAERADLMCELNVKAQVANVCQTHIVQRAWDNGQELSVHGFIYGIHDGRLKNLDVSVSSKEQLHPLDRFETKDD